MIKKNYHGEEVKFREGQLVTHVDDDGAEHAAQILKIKNSLAELKFEDGEQGWEEINTLYQSGLKKVLIPANIPHEKWPVFRMSTNAEKAESDKIIAEILNDFCEANNISPTAHLEVQDVDIVGAKGDNDLIHLIVEISD